MNHTLHAACITLALALVACSGDSPARGTRCTTDRDCAGGLCQEGLCTAIGSGVGALDGGADEGPDFSPGDVRAQDAAPDVEDEVAPDAVSDGPPRNACGGTAVLDRVVGDECGPCDDGEWVCNGLDAVRCDGASSLNLCGGCGPLPGMPGAPCDGCDGGRWTCDAEELVCQCDLPSPDGTCAAPYPIGVDDSETFSTCGEGDNEDPVRGEEDCRDVNVRGEDRVYRLVLDQATRVFVRMRDDDSSQAIDTVVYLRSDCEDDTSQLICRDDVPCDQSEIDPHTCDGNVQVRESFFEIELEAGTYYLIADSFTYASGAGAFSCGDVLLEVREAGE